MERLKNVFKVTRLVNDSVSSDTAGPASESLRQRPLVSEPAEA